MKRREFLRKVVTVPAVVAAAEWFAGDRTVGVRPVGITAVVYDERYADCRSFAKALERHGAVSFATAGDAASLWHGALRVNLARKGGSVAGMTPDSDWVVSRTCGREQGLEAAYEGSHDCRASDQLLHRLLGGSARREVCAELWCGRSPWAESVASGLVHFSSQNGIWVTSDVAVATDVVVTQSSPDHPGYLTTWLLRRATLRG
ncbi:MAG TPA: hypothetical protein VEI55_04145 [Candidatus Acidoferrum sp.]|nr:hypothetical protein [Candidatus Acidoferrum sp.]